MDVIPAIDLMSGKCVRLIQGEYHRRITYEDDPVRQGRLFIEAGAEYLHIVDLDGARVGRPVNIDSVRNIVSLEGLQIELGGGIRNEQAIQMTRKSRFRDGLRMGRTNCGILPPRPLICLSLPSYIQISAKTACWRDQILKGQKHSSMPRKCRFLPRVELPRSAISPGLNNSVLPG